jgi:hypothetical protein
MTIITNSELRLASPEPLYDRILIKGHKTRNFYCVSESLGASAMDRKAEIVTCFNLHLYSRQLITYICSLPFALPTSFCRISSLLLSCLHSFISSFLPKFLLAYLLLPSVHSFLILSTIPSSSSFIPSDFSSFHHSPIRTFSPSFLPSSLISSCLLILSHQKELCSMHTFPFSVKGSSPRHCLADLCSTHVGLRRDCGSSSSGVLSYPMCVQFSSSSLNN